MERTGHSSGISWIWWVLPIVLAPLLWWGLQGRIMQRVLIAQVQADSSVRNPAIRWTSRTGEESGAWLMPAPPAPDAPPTDRLTESLRLSLPTYPIAEFRLTWEGPADSKLSMEDTRVENRLVRFVLERHDLASKNHPGTASTTGDARQQFYEAPPNFGPKVFAIGAIATAIALYAALVLVVLAPRLARSALLAHLLVWSIILLVNGYYAARVPCLVTSDGIDYIDAADWLAREASFTHFVPYKAPGLGFLLAIVIVAFENVLLCFARVQVAMGIATAFLAYALVRSRFSRHWGLLAALIVGMHPVLVTYRFYLLRETASALICMAVVVLLSRLVSLPTSSAQARMRLRAPLCIAIGVLGAVGAYLRENLQLFALYLPIAMLLLGGLVVASSNPSRVRRTRYHAGASRALVLA